MISASNSNIALTLSDVSRLVDDHLINSCVVDEVRKLTESRDRWKSISNAAEILGQFFLSAGTILLFASSTYDCDPIISFVAGCINVVSLSLLRFSIHSYQESKERSSALELLLQKINQQAQNMHCINFQPPASQNIVQDIGLPSPLVRSSSKEMPNNSFGRIGSNSSNLV